MQEGFGDIKLLAESILNIGEIYVNKGDYSQAMEQYTRSLKMFKQIYDKQGITRTLISIGELKNVHGQYQDAIESCDAGFKLAVTIKAISEKRNACKCMYDSYKALGNDNKALAYHEQMIVLNDSLNVKETEKKLQQMEFARQVQIDSLAQVEKERLIQEANEEKVNKQNRAKQVAIGIGSLLLLFAAGLYSRIRYINKAKTIIEKERDRSDNLLLNILPLEIAQELKEKGRAEARNFEMVSVLFSDFKEFTSASEKLTAHDLVSEVNTCFEAFDGIMEKYGIEKIKTIGDAYMAAGGLPVPHPDSTKNAVLAGLEMQSFIENRKIEKEAQGQTAFAMRIGIHSGPVVAGIVGAKKFQYDIWGDTVNTASRIESNSQAGKVNISQSTYELLKHIDSFVFQSRGKIQVKGKGEMEMYFVERVIK